MMRQFPEKARLGVLARWGLWPATPTRLTAGQRALVRHTTGYVLVSLLMLAFWLAVGDTYFNPRMPLIVWGAGLGWHAWTVLGDRASGSA